MTNGLTLMYNEDKSKQLSEAKILAKAAFRMIRPDQHIGRIRTRKSSNDPHKYIVTIVPSETIENFNINIII